MRINDFRTAVEVAVSVFTRELALTSRQDQYSEEELWDLFEVYVRERGVSAIKSEADNDDDIPF